MYCVQCAHHKHFTISELFDAIYKGEEKQLFTHNDLVSTSQSSLSYHLHLPLPEIKQWQSYLLTTQSGLHINPTYDHRVGNGLMVMLVLQTDGYAMFVAGPKWMSMKHQLVLLPRECVYRKTAMSVNTAR